MVLQRADMDQNNIHLMKICARFLQKNFSESLQNFLDEHK